MWSVLASRYVLENRYIKVREDVCRTESGHDVGPYYTLDYPDFVHVVALTPSRELVLVEQYRHGLGGTSLELPGGMMDQAGEVDPVMAGLRELEEETGLRADEGRLVASLSPDPAKFRNRLHLVVASGLHVAGAKSADPLEQTAVRLVRFGDIGRLFRSAAIAHAAHLGLLALGLIELGHPDALTS
jgi:8-oxo-dGTP pyrophosphatase MutT (NUDIX family)